VKSITLEGQVAKELSGQGTKSEHEAVYLVISEDTRYKLHRKNGNPFQDEVLDGLVGKYISAKGYLYQSHFIMDSYQEKKQEP
jgi:tRNA uridine 5-carbamoylmethylation protein Kti12